MTDTVGTRICAVRRQKGLSQAELANLLGVSKGSISRYETSSREPRYSTLCAIAQALSVPVQQLAEQPAADKPDAPAMPLTRRERKLRQQQHELLQLFDLLSSKGRSETIRRVRELSRLPEYQKGD